jgi:hypothetical protein
MTPEQKAGENAVHAKRKRDCYAAQPEEQKEKIRADTNKHVKKHRASMDAEKKALVGDKDKERKAASRSQTRNLREQSYIRAEFESANLWDRPGRDYKLDKYRNCPEAAALTWYATNGSWRDREAKWLLAYLHLKEQLQNESSESTERLDMLYKACIEYRVSLVRVAYENFTEADWILQRAWQREHDINDPELSALAWYALAREEEFDLEDSELGYVSDKDKWT